MPVNPGYPPVPRHNKGGPVGITKRIATTLAAAAITATAGIMAVPGIASAQTTAPRIQTCNTFNDVYLDQWGPDGGGHYFKAEWTANPCVQKIEVRAWCIVLPNQGWIGPSGPVKAVKLWTGVTCAGNIGTGQLRYTNPATGAWYSWVTACHPCNGAKQGRRAVAGSQWDGGSNGRIWWSPAG